VPPRLLPLFKGPTSKGMEGNGRGEEKVKGKEEDRWREGFGPPRNFGVAPPMNRVPRTALPNHLCRHFCCWMYRLAASQTETEADIIMLIAYHTACSPTG